MTLDTSAETDPTFPHGGLAYSVFYLSPSTGIATGSKSDTIIIIM